MKSPVPFGQQVVVRIVAHVRQQLPNGMVIVITASGESVVVHPDDIEEPKS